MSISVIVPGDRRYDGAAFNMHDDAVFASVLGKWVEDAALSMKNEIDREMLAAYSTPKGV